MTWNVTQWIMGIVETQQEYKLLRDERLKKYLTKLYSCFSGYQIYVYECLMEVFIIRVGKEHNPRKNCDVLMLSY